jgi:hypothetical protein
MEIDEAGGWTSRLRSISRLRGNVIYSTAVAVPALRMPQFTTSLHSRDALHVTIISNPK